jgi:ATP-dependent protease HslVU (ClpYQ) peptidase subunit
MSVIVAVKENGTIYMGADSQTTAGRLKFHNLNEIGYKVAKLPNGVLVGFCGRVASRQTILSLKDVFTLDSQGQLTKKHIVKEIVPKIIDKIDRIGDKESGAMDLSILLAYKDKLYRIKYNLEVISLNDYGTAGAGLYYVDYHLSLKDIPVKDRIINALRESARRADTVDGPFVLIDTNKLEYEIFN